MKYLLLCLLAIGCNNYTSANSPLYTESVRACWYKGKTKVDMSFCKNHNATIFYNEKRPQNIY
jgi:hypothetical protein